MIKPQALLSIHDVMPSNLERVEQIFSLCQESGVNAVTLLVVPGKPWNPASIKRVRDLVQCGAALAGHGWSHEIDTRELKTLPAKLHSAIISRNVAEHLALESAEIENLIRRCYAWFAEQDFPLPELYVPPAWAMGSLDQAKLNGLPFRYYETFFGIYDNKLQQFNYSPLTGYEADTWFRGLTLRIWNQLNLLLSRFKTPLRIGIHPYDLDYRVASELRRDIRRPFDFSYY